MADTLIAYPDIVRDALRAVPAEVLRQVEENGLPGDHHFYIEFRTDVEGVMMPPGLKAQYPDTMTIVLQNDFRDLRVDELGFAVNLSFGGSRTDLYVPFASMNLFVDPSVEFALQFSTELPETSKEKPKAKPETETKGNVVEVDFSRKS